MSGPNNPALFAWFVEQRSLHDEVTFIDRPAGFGTEITLRDLFAAAALAGYLASPGSCGDDARSNPDKAAEWAYENASAMLRAREAGK